MTLRLAQIYIYKRNARLQTKINLAITDPRYAGRGDDRFYTANIRIQL